MSFEEQIMSKDKYPSILSPQMEAIVLIILFLKTGEYSRIFPSFSWGIFGHTRSRDDLGPIAREGKDLIDYN